MLPATQRLRRTSDIQRVYKTGRAISTPVLRVFAAATAQTQAVGQSSRATVVVSTRVSKKATDRNRIKRRIRTDLRPLLTSLAEAQDIVVVAQPKAATLDGAQLTGALQSCFKRLRLV